MQLAVSKGRPGPDGLAALSEDDSRTLRTLVASASVAPVPLKLTTVEKGIRRRILLIHERVGDVARRRPDGSECAVAAGSVRRGTVPHHGHGTDPYSAPKLLLLLARDRRFGTDSPRVNNVVMTIGRMETGNAPLGGTLLLAMMRGMAVVTMIAGFGSRPARNTRVFLVDDCHRVAGSVVRDDRVVVGRHDRDVGRVRRIGERSLAGMAAERRG